jgi:hypothetical protein
VLQTAEATSVIVIGVVRPCPSSQPDSDVEQDTTSLSQSTAPATYLDLKYSLFIKRKLGLEIKPYNWNQDIKELKHDFNFKTLLP